MLSYNKIQVGRIVVLARFYNTKTEHIMRFYIATDYVKKQSTFMIHA